MFAAALLHARPDCAETVLRHVRAAIGVDCTTEAASDGALHGLRFGVPADAAHDGRHPHHDHHHAHWATIRRDLNDGRLPEAIAARATRIFAALAEAEARVHGTAPDDVVFHEVGARDSIGDIVAAATLIVELGIGSASTAPLPLGGGRIETAHGIMPVPAPATVLLLEGLPTLDDGIAGERVTPTGAAILRDLAPGAARGGVLAASGFGFGTRRLPGLANCLRVLLFEEATATSGAIPHRRLAVVTFEIDDQSGEDLATGLERLRASDGIHDVLQLPAIGKKGRLAVQIQVLADAAAAERAIDACFRETTTIGLRLALVEGRALRRTLATVPTSRGPVRVKRVERPGGATAKAEADDLVTQDAAGRARLRAEATRADRTLLEENADER